MADLTPLIGTMKYPDGVVPTTAFLRFTLTGYETDLDADIAWVPRERTVDLEADGSFSKDLWPNEAGERESQYHVELVVTYTNASGTSVTKTFDYKMIEVPVSATPIDITELLGQSTIPNDDVVSVDFLTSFIGITILDGGAPSSTFPTGINFNGGTP